MIDPAVMAVGAALLMVGALRWRESTIAVPIVAIFEGALRKWIFPEYSQPLYFAKDVLLIGVYIGFLTQRVRSHSPLPYHPANLPLGVLTLLAVLQLMSPSLPNLSVGVFGLRAYLLHVPLMYVVPEVLRDPPKAREFFRAFFAIALIPLALGLIQFAAPIDSPLNRYAWDEERAPRVAVVNAGANARITGTFSYVSGYASYLILLLLALLSFAFLDRRPHVGKALLFVVGLGGVANLLMTGSRGAVLIVLASAALLILYLGWRTTSRGIVLVAATLTLTVILVATALPDASSAMLGRFEQSDDLRDRIWGIVSEPIRAVEQAGLVGYGVGTTHQAAIYLRDASAAVPPDAEGEWERIILEIGPIGFALTLLIRILVITSLWRALRAAADTALEPCLAAALLFTLVNISGHLVFGHTASIFYWFLAGFALIPIKQPGPRRLRDGSATT